ncbi:MAG: dephospho-CoA kinase [Corynebacterium glucuronolyticum]|nr:dephospho-CoA kinase [Corynebacterium glucuronolyticum]MDD7586937.1 dephospho-CoA kinase [Mycobacteriaceae bacterium]MDY5833595.1 dephospho-CoA kinase [Corynebacterium glucuronolyticum]
MLVGLTGGMGSGKSTVARMLVEAGFVLIDSDRIAYSEVQSPAVLEQLAARFGDDILTGREEAPLDRALLAELAFATSEGTAALNAITHPAIRNRTLGLIEQADPQHNPVVVDMPLLVETGFHTQCDAVIVVVADPELRVERLVNYRGLDPDDARARIAKQASDEERAAVADYVLDNNKDLPHLESQVKEVISELTRG